MSAIPAIVWGTPEPEERATYYVTDAGRINRWVIVARWVRISSSTALLRHTIATHDGRTLSVEELASAVGHQTHAVERLLRVWALLAFRDAERDVRFVAEFPVRRVWSEPVVTWEVPLC